MKKVISLLLVSVLAVGNVGFAATPVKTTKAPVTAPVVATKTGVILNFTDKTVTINVAGKAMTYKYDAKTKAMSAGQAGMVSEFLSKGMVAKFTEKNGMLVTVDIGAMGEGGGGTLNMFSAIATRIAETDDNFMPTDSDTVKNWRKELPKVESDLFALTDKNAIIELGGFDLVGLPKVMIGDRELKFTAGEFDKTADNDEFKMSTKEVIGNFKSIYQLINLEKPLTDAEVPTVKVTYTKKMFQMTSAETYSYPISENVVCELNGKPASYIKTLNRANYALFATNLMGEVAYVNGYYNNLEAKVTKAEKGKLSFSVYKNNALVFSDVVVVDQDVYATDAKGAIIDYTKIKAGTDVKFSVDPDLGYRVVLLQTK